MSTAAKQVYVELIARTQRFNNSLKKADARVKKTTTGLKVMAAALAASLAVGLRKAAREFEEFAAKGDSIAKLARGLRISVGELQELQFVLKRTGGDAGSVRNMMVSLEKAMGEAASGSKEYVDSFAAMNVNHKELEKLNPAERFWAIRRAMQAAKGDVEAIAGATIVLGRGFKGNLATLAETEENVLAVREEYKKLGGVSEEAAALSETVEDLNTNWALLKDTIASTAFEIVAPGVIKSKEAFQEWIVELKDSGKLVAIVKAALVGLSAVFIALAAAIVGIGVVLAPVGLGFAAIIVAVGALSAAVISLALHWTEFWQALKLVYNDTVKFVEYLMGGAVQGALNLWNGLKGALGFGEDGKNGKDGKDARPVHLKKEQPAVPEFIQQAAGVSPPPVYQHGIGVKSMLNPDRPERAQITNVYHVQGMTAEQLESKVRRQNDSQRRGNRR